jgi:hypothetical protein
MVQLRQVPGQGGLPVTQFTDKTTTDPYGRFPLARSVLAIIRSSCARVVALSPEADRLTCPPGRCV